MRRSGNGCRVFFLPLLLLTLLCLTGGCDSEGTVGEDGDGGAGIDGGGGGGDGDGLGGGDGVEDGGGDDGGVVDGDGLDGGDGGDECVTCTGNGAAFVSQQVPTTVTTGASFPVEITMMNTGTTTWSQDEGYKLGSQNPQDNQTWGFVRIWMEEGDSVPPGQSYTFSRTLTAPAAEGAYDFQWRMVHEGVEWFGELTPNLTINVEEPEWAQYSQNPFVFDIQQPVPNARGGFFVHDLDGDGLMDFVVTGPDNVGAYDHYGNRLWVKNIGIKTTGNYPGLHHPGAIAGDMDGDGEQEIAYLTPSDNLRILDGVTGVEESSFSSGGAEAVAIANLRGLGDRDAILQYDQTHLKAIRLDTGGTLWETTDYISVEHSPLRQADLDGDGLDEVAGLTFIDDDGSLMNAWNLADRGTALWSVDSIAIADIVPGGPLEAALAEQGGNNEAIVANHQSVIFGTYNTDNPCCAVANECRERDPDKVAVGDFRPAREGLEIFCRSACGRAPWVFNADGQKIAQWSVDDTSPTGWYIDGIEEISPIDWDGNAKDEIVAKERHVDGDGAIINATTGDFIHIFPGAAVRIYAADISGDYREEVITLDAGGEIRVFWNDENNNNPPKERYWTRQHYRRQKQNWNYYSP